MRLSPLIDSRRSADSLKMSDLPMDEHGKLCFKKTSSIQDLERDSYAWPLFAGDIQILSQSDMDGIEYGSQIIEFVRIKLTGKPKLA